MNNQDQDAQRLHDAICGYAVEIESLTEEGAREWLDEVLEVMPYFSFRNEEFEFSDIQILLTYGGPTVRLRWEGGESLKLRGQTMCCDVTMLLESEGLISVLREFVESLEERISEMVAARTNSGSLN